MTQCIKTFLNSQDIRTSHALLQFKNLFFYVIQISNQIRLYNQHFVLRSLLLRENLLCLKDYAI